MVLLSQCVDACESLGDTGGMLFAAAVGAWGLYQKYQKSKAITQSLTATARADKAESERELYKQLSLRPAAMPLISIPPDMLSRLQSAPAPADELGDETPEQPDSAFEEPPRITIPAKPGAK